MSELIAWINENLEHGDLHPLLATAIFIVVFLEIHPFQDGNGSDEKMERVQRVASGLMGTTICAFGEATGGPMRTFVEKFPEEFRNQFPS